MESYSETLERIYNLRGGMIDLRLDRVERALALFDHPEKKYPSLHIAGTNGKGSTSAMLHRMLSLAGYRTCALHLAALGFVHRAHAYRRL
jgi:dihydrofolate synthase/folylpolyglutamate synthase